MESAKRQVVGSGCTKACCAGRRIHRQCLVIGAGERRGTMRRIVQVGVGDMGRVWARAVAETASWEAAAYVDVNHAHLMAAAEAHGMPIERCFSDVQTALATVEADALLDVTPQQHR